MWGQGRIAESKVEVVDRLQRVESAQEATGVGLRSDPQRSLGEARRPLEAGGPNSLKGTQGYEPRNPQITGMLHHRGTSATC